MGLVFRYMIEFPTFANPPKRKDELEESLREFLQTSGFDYVMGALGGMARTYGQVGRKQGDALPEDRELLRSWLAKQPMKCVVRIGSLEKNSPNIDVLGVITETIVTVDNLTDEDRAEAATFAEKISKLIQQRAKPTTE